MSVNSATEPSFLAEFFRSKRFEIAITIIIVTNAVLMALETFPSATERFGHVIEWSNVIILAIFVVELSLKMFAFGRNFWREGWNWFDLCVVLLSLLPATEAFAALRALRAIRLLRLVTAVPSLRRVVEGLLHAIPGLGSIVVVLLLLLFVFSLMGTRLFGQTHPDFFGSLGSSAFSLFTVMTLEGWPDLAREVMKDHPMAWAFFIVFIMISSWAVLNLFIGVIVDSMQAHTRAKEEALELQALRNQERMMIELKEIKAELTALRGGSKETTGG